MTSVKFVEFLSLPQYPMSISNSLKLSSIGNILANSRPCADVICTSSITTDGEHGVRQICERVRIAAEGETGPIHLCQ